jgi:BarA-like signal transduction histidine kinase
MPGDGKLSRMWSSRRCCPAFELPRTRVKRQNIAGDMLSKPLAWLQLLPTSRTRNSHPHTRDTTCHVHLARTRP